MTLTAVPAPPPRDGRTRRYPMTTVRKARLLYQGEWSIKQIIDYIEGERGVRPSRTTVRCWVEPGFAEHHNAITARGQARQRLKVRHEAGAPPQEAPPARLTDDMVLALRLEDKLSMAAMCAVIARFYGETVTVHQLRARLDRLGVPRDENKARRVAGNPGRFPQRTAA